MEIDISSLFGRVIALQHTVALLIAASDHKDNRSSSALLENLEIELQDMAWEQTGEA